MLMVFEGGRARRGLCWYGVLVVFVFCRFIFLHCVYPGHNAQAGGESWAPPLPCTISLRDDESRWAHWACSDGNQIWRLPLGRSRCSKVVALYCVH
jgi:hypothetical protein